MKFSVIIVAFASFVLSVSSQPILRVPGVATRDNGGKLVTDLEGRDHGGKLGTNPGHLTLCQLHPKYFENCH